MILQKWGTLKFRAKQIQARQAEGIAIVKIPKRGPTKVPSPLKAF